MKFTALCTTALFCLGSISCMSSLEAFPKTRLHAPLLSEDCVSKVSVSLHDYREKGIRVEPVYQREKLIIHNYGHGGSSLALAWGSAEEAFNYLETEILSGEYVFDFGKVAVLGAGAVGLTTANYLLDRGYKVHVYSEKFAPRITNDLLEGIWWPTAVSTGHSRQEKSAFKRILKSSYNHFKGIAEASHPAYAGVAKQTIYAFDLANKHNRTVIDDLFGEGISVSVGFDTGKRRHGVCYDTFRIDPNAYIRSLYEQALRKGAVFVQRSFNNKRELEDLEENLIFNCVGKGSKLLFDDHELITLRHQTVVFPPQDGVDYMLRSYLSDGMNATTILSLDDKVVLGGIYQFGDASGRIDAGQTKELIDNANQFFN